MGNGGADLTRTYVIEPLSFMIAAAGKLLFHVPDFDDNDETFGDRIVPPQRRIRSANQCGWP
ncbi:MAG UNVERIFIED_CONTAM: hypothetical protein LVR18_24755 [Planctomycetaceae bacterium]